MWNRVYQTLAKVVLELEQKPTGHIDLFKSLPVAKLEMSTVKPNGDCSVMASTYCIGCKTTSGVT